MQGKENYTDEKVYDDDLNQIAKNANDGGGFRDAIQAAETITALRPVFLDDTTNQWKYCDANDVDRLNFDGFALEAGSANTAMAVQLEGIVRGLSSLDVGKKYYVQDDGTIGTTVGTAEIKVGLAISATELFIQKGSFEYIGTASGSYSSQSDQTTVIAITVPAGARFAIFSHLKTAGTTGGGAPLNTVNNGTLAKVGASSLNLLNNADNAVGGFASAGTIVWSGNTITATSVGSANFVYNALSANMTIWFYK